MLWRNQMPHWGLRGRVEESWPSQAGPMGPGAPGGVDCCCWCCCCGCCDCCCCCCGAPDLLGGRPLGGCWAGELANVGHSVRELMLGGAAEAGGCTTTSMGLGVVRGGGGGRAGAEAPPGETPSSSKVMGVTSRPALAAGVALWAAIMLARSMLARLFFCRHYMRAGKAGHHIIPGYEGTQGARRGKPPGTSDGAATYSHRARQST